jgi:hypothetical protein
VGLPSIAISDPNELVAQVDRTAYSRANHAAATALNYFAYNFIKIHRTLRVSPAMAAGVTARLWSVEDLVALWEAYEQRRAERAA